MRPAPGVIAGANNTLKDNCLTLNGQYGFQSSDVNSWGVDSLTGGPYNVTVEDNEISYNDTCDFQGPLTNKAIGWSNYNAVPARYRNPHCGAVTPDGDEGGFKLWQTNGVTVKDNYIHNNWGPGAWVDTDNANTTFTGNTITDNDGPAISEEISYNFSITNNYLADNGWAEGLANPGFPTPAIYVSQSGSDKMFGGVPACPEASCSGQDSYTSQSVISGNTFVNNGGNVFLWQNSDRYCSAGFDNVCTLVGGAPSGPFTMTACKSNLRSASINTTTYARGNAGSRFAGLVGRLHVVDGKREGHPEHHRLQPSGNRALQQDCLARLRGRGDFCGIQYVAALQPARGLGDTQPGHVLRERYLVQQCLQRPVDLFRLEPGQWQQSGQLGGLDRRGAEGR